MRGPRYAVGGAGVVVLYLVGGACAEGVAYDRHGFVRRGKVVEAMVSRMFRLHYRYCRNLSGRSLGRWSPDFLTGSFKSDVIGDDDPEQSRSQTRTVRENRCSCGLQELIPE